jgi:cell wall-associated NlpC family hydrolase
VPNGIADCIERAIEWAGHRLGSLDYPFKCLAFVEDAYELANGLTLDGYASAGEAAEGYGLARDAGPPPRGAFVFYECHGSIDGLRRDWGHVGIAQGDGTIIHAWGAVRIDDYLVVQELTPAAGWSAPRYVGWSPAADIINHHREVRSLL